MDGLLTGNKAQSGERNIMTRERKQKKIIPPFHVKERQILLPILSWLATFHFILRESSLLLSCESVCLFPLLLLPWKHYGSVEAIKKTLRHFMSKLFPPRKARWTTQRKSHVIFQTVKGRKKMRAALIEKFALSPWRKGKFLCKRTHLISICPSDLRTTSRIAICWKKVFFTFFPFLLVLLLEL